MTREDLLLLEAALVDAHRKVEAALTKVKDELYNTSPRRVPSQPAVNRGTAQLKDTLTTDQRNRVAFELARAKADE